MRRPSDRRTPGFSSPAVPNRISLMRSHLECDESAVDGVVAARDEGGSVGTEEQCELGDFVRAAHPADRLTARELVEHLRLSARIILREEAIHERRVDAR